MCCIFKPTRVMERWFCVSTDHKHSFSAPYSPSIPANSNLAQMQQGEVQLEKRGQMKTEEKWKGHQGRGKKRERERSRRKYMTSEELTMSACVQRKQSTTTHLPTHFLQLNVAFGEAQRCALFAHPCWKIIYRRLFVPCLNKRPQ